MKKQFFKHKKLLKYLILLCLIFNEAFADTINVDVNTDKNISTILTSDNIINLNFNSNLNIDSNSNQNSVYGIANSYGNIIFSPNKIFTVNNIGSATNSVNNIIFDSGGILQLNNISTQYPDNSSSAIFVNNGISSKINKTGTLKLSGEIPYLGNDNKFLPSNFSHIIDGSVGNSINRISNISIDAKNANINFKKSVFTDNFVIDGTVATTVYNTYKYTLNNLKIDDNFIANNTEITDSVVSILGSSTNINFGDLKINATDIPNAGFSQLFLNKSQSINVDNIIFDSISSSDKKYISNEIDSNLYVNKNISGKGSIEGGNIIFNGSSAQTSEVNIKLGAIDDYIQKIQIRNNSNGGVVFKGDIYSKNLDFSLGDKVSNIKLESGSIFQLSGDIISKENNGTISGDGKLILEGENSKIINAMLGSSSINKLSNLEIAQTKSNNSIILNNKNYITNLAIKSATTIENNDFLSVDNLAIEKNSELKINSDNKIANINIYANKSLALLSNNDLKISGNIVGGASSSIVGNSNSTGSIAFVGSLSQEIDANIEIGKDNLYLSKISSQNISSDGVKFLNNVKTKNLEFTNTQGTSIINIANGKSIYLAGDILQNNKNSSAIIGSGSLELNGEYLQNIDTKIGKDSSNRLNSLIINNNYGVLLKQNSFINNLSINNGQLTIDDSATLDVTNNIDLTNKKIGINITSGQYGKIVSAGEISVNDSTKIKFDYSKTIGANLDITGQTKYDILVASNTISNVDKILVEDNSLLYDNQITSSSNKIVTNLVKSSQFQESVLGKEKYNSLQGLIDLQNSKIKDGLLSIQSNSQLDNSLNSIKPIENSMIYNQLISHIDDLFDIAMANDNDIVDQNSNIDNDEAREKSLNKKPNQIEAKNSNLNEEESSLKNYSLWWRLLGNRFTQKVLENNNEYNGKATGLMIGLNKKIDLKNHFLTIGSAVSSSMININNNSNKNLDINSYQLLFYQGIYNKSGEGFFNNNMLLIAHNNHDTNRTIEIGNYKNSFKSSYGGKMFSFESKVGFKKDFFNKRFNISPLIGLQYLAINNDDYLEKQDDLAIEYKNQFYHQVIAKIGLEFDSKIKTNNYIFSPNFMFSYNRNLLNNSVNDSYNIANARSGNSIINSSLNKISVNSKIVQINKFNVATGLNIFTKNHESVRLKYQLQTAKNFINHSGFVEYKKEF